MARVDDWLRLLDDLYPPSWAEEWDSSGFQVGDRQAEAARTLVALDPTEAVIREAAERGCGLLVTHHPLLLRPRARLDVADPVARAVATAFAAGVAVTACHTNADVAAPGVSDALAEVLGVVVEGVLEETAAGDRVKLVTFVPPEATDKVLDALAGAGAGVIGEYTRCSFRVRGAGTFVPTAAASPTVGERGALNEVEEDRLEVVLPAARLGPIARALVEAHPYEEVAYDVYPLATRAGLGLGRIGTLAEPTDAAGLAERCRERLGAAARLAGDPGRRVERVAVCGGSAASLIPAALAAGVDAYVTGDVKHHDALDATVAGLAVIDAGHHATEWPFVPAVAERLNGSGLGEALVSEISTDPFGDGS